MVVRHPNKVADLVKFMAGRHMNTSSIVSTALFFLFFYFFLELALVEIVNKMSKFCQFDYLILDNSLI